MTEIFLILALLLFLAKLFGEVFERLGLTSIVGEVFAGIIAGPVLGVVISGPFFESFILVSIALLLFIAGLGVRYEDISQNIYISATLATAGGFLSFIFGFAVGMLFFNDLLVALAIGIILITTSNGTVFILLMKLGKFKSSIGRLIVSTSVADDVVGILSLSFFTLFIANSAVPYGDIFKLFLVSIGFYLVILTAGARIFNKVLNIGGLFRNEQILFSLPISIMFIVSVFTENINLGFATGAFVAGMAISKSKFTESIIVPKVNVLAYGFVLPVFFAIIGSLLTLNGMNPLLVILLLAAAVFGKIIGAGLLSRFFGVRGNNLRLMSIMMVPRGDSNIVIAQIALLLGVITQDIYTSVIFSIILTIILTPVLLKLFVGK